MLDIAPKNTGLEDLAQLYIFLIPIVREKMVVTVRWCFATISRCVKCKRLADEKTENLFFSGDNQLKFREAFGKD